MSSKSAFRSVLLVLMDGVFIVAVLQAARLVVGFFGELSGTQVGETFLSLTQYLVLPLGMSETATHFGGTFDWNTLVSLGIVLALEVILGVVRQRA